MHRGLFFILFWLPASGRKEKDFSLDEPVNFQLRVFTKNNVPLSFKN